jgi:hypothetical protein
MAVSPGGKWKGFLLRRVLQQKASRGAITQPPLWYRKISGVSFPRAISCVVYAVQLSFTQGYEQMVNNATKEILDPVTEIVLDARSRGRQVPRRLSSSRDLISYVDSWAQTLNPDQDSHRDTYHIHSLFHSIHS